jgi:ATP dependent DNA ligase domain/DNA ligase OB-like domain
MKKKFPTLFHKGKGGALVQWSIWTEGDTIFTKHGQVGGKMQLSPKKAIAKNVGRSNETTAEEQAILEAKSMWTFKVERKYSETKEDAQEEVFLPMLAGDFKKRKGKEIYYPVDVQPKLDGCLEYNTQIDFEDGTSKFLGDVVEEKFVGKIKTYNIRTKNIEYKQILNWHKNLKPLDNRSLIWYEINTKNGKSIKVTGNHKIWINSLSCYMRVDEIYKNKSHILDVLTVSMEITEIKSIINLGVLFQDSYDIEIEENHNFFANGILVHNCRGMASWEDNHIILGTRSGKEWTAPKHIIKELEQVMPHEMVLDGELYLHNTTFEDLSSWTKKVYPETSQLEYHIFDMPLDESGAKLPWNKRRENLIQFFKDHKFDKIKLVETKIANNEKDVLVFEEEFVSKGYEGAIVRNLTGEYLFGHRSNDLLKVKSSQDDEYKIVGFEHGVGKFDKSVIWICETENKQFKVIPKTTQEKREDYYKNAKKYIGQYLKVRFQNLTKDLIPRFPRGVGFRDKKDM